MYSAISFLIVVLLSPIWIPLGIYIGLMYHWEDTVPSQEDLEYGSKNEDDE